MNLRGLAHFRRRCSDGASLGLAVEEQKRSLILRDLDFDAVVVGAFLVLPFLATQGRLLRVRLTEFGCVSAIVRLTAAFVSGNVRRKWPSIARRTGLLPDLVLNVSRAFGAIRRSPPSFEMLNPRNLLLRSRHRALRLVDLQPQLAGAAGRSATACARCPKKHLD
jgi:hypothetical protein